METKVFDAPIREFKTRIAAERFVKRMVGGGTIKVNTESAFDMYHKAGKKLYCVYPH